MKKKRPIKSLRLEAWQTFSRWVKKRDKYTCVTCGKKMSFGDPNCQGGHFIHGNSLDFDERNINCQCVRCNKWLHGAGVDYTVFMMKKHGEEVIRELKRLKRETRKFKREELEGIIEKYKEGKK